MKRTILRLAPATLSKSRVQTRVQTRSSPIDVSKQGWGDSIPDIEPGQHVLSICKQHDIFFPSQLRPLKGIFSAEDGNPYNIGVSHSQKHCVLHQSMKYFDRITHPFAISLLDIYIEKKKEPLWLSGFAHGATPFPNRTASRRIAHALRDALEAAGYDRFGRKVLVDGESSAIADLHGTLRVICNNPLAVCNAQFADLVACAEQIIRHAETRLRRDKNGRHFAELGVRRDGWDDAA
ncbi:hypothetical protein GQX73_g6680 [Xylaria multiplex]|uniref:Uncharacterized protein n=1 Tax=Xylaria multiplex TaxID=323545 RepID=A0A7C8MKB3_9PEZI|nr:hypothetical protein GQX73_g6680 [Xylaria multiplex]